MTGLLFGKRKMRFQSTDEVDNARYYNSQSLFSPSFVIHQTIKLKIRTVE